VGSFYGASALWMADMTPVITPISTLVRPRNRLR
jgi:hypothetical protein